MKKELYEVTRVRGDEKKELGSYLLKPGPEAAMDFFHNILKRDDKLEVSIKSTETGFSLTDNSEPDVRHWSRWMIRSGKPAQQARTAKPLVPSALCG